MTADQIEGVDFALAAYREEGVWQVQELAHDVLEDVDTLVARAAAVPRRRRRARAWSPSTRTSS